MLIAEERKTLLRKINLCKTNVNHVRVFYANIEHKWKNLQNSTPTHPPHRKLNLYTVYTVYSWSMSRLQMYTIQLYSQQIINLQVTMEQRRWVQEKTEVHWIRSYKKEWSPPDCILSSIGESFGFRTLR